ncbi:MAG TPA: WYL domain-containing protein [Nocardioides sp.]|nr:WYL domain-containing protein [Nocardioides sp.]
MAKVPGRDQRAPMERLVRIAAMLQERPEQGVSADTLVRVAGFHGDAARDQLKREIRYLEDQGWRIENVAPQGETAVYRMTTVDNRLRVKLSPEQQAALRRAVLLADRADLVRRLGLPESSQPSSQPAGTPAASVRAAEPEALSLVVDAVKDGAVLRFGYKGTPRVVHPESLRNHNGTWYLRGVEDTDPHAQVKTFVVSRMVDADSDDPHTARPVPAAHHTGLHPMSWEIDPPVEVTLRALAHFEPDVRRWLGEPLSVEPDGADAVLIRYRVTHRAALRARLNELGERVRIVGPPEVRAEVVAALDAARGTEEA